MSRSPIPPDNTLLPLLYAIDSTYGWGKGMRAVTASILTDLLPAKERILEIGCGSGIQLRQVSSRKPQALAVGTDLHPLALAHAQNQRTYTPRSVSSSLVQFVQSDLHHLPFTDDEFDFVVALDVFDQIGVQLRQALNESRRVLQPGGHLLVRVSAYAWLMGEHDRAFHTAQRYNRRALAPILVEAGFTIMRSTYANALFAPPVIGLRLVQRWAHLPHREQLYTNSLSNRLLAAALQWEAIWLRSHNLPAGISLYLLARKE